MPLLLVLAVACYASAASVRVVDPLVPGLAREFATSIERAALLTSAYSFLYAAGQPVLGALGDALGKVRVIKACLALMMIGLIGSLLAKSFELLFASRMISGLAGGGIIPVAIAIVGDRVPLSVRQIALSRLVMASQIAIFIAAALGGWIAANFGWRWSFGLVLAVTATAFVATAIWLEPDAQSKRKPLNLAGMRAGYAEVLANPVSYVCCTGVFIEGIAIYGLMPFVAGRLESRGLGGLTEAGLVIAAMSIGAIGFTLVVGRLLAWLGREGLIRAGGCVCAVALAALAASQSWQLEACLFMLLGLGFFMVHNSLQAVGTELAPNARGSAVALFVFCLFLGQAMGPVVYGPAFAAFGPHMPIVAAAVLMPAMSFWVAHRLTRLAPQKVRLD
jgi:predicted MFS family arabinose efflux permease